MPKPAGVGPGSTFDHRRELRDREPGGTAGPDLVINPPVLDLTRTGDTTEALEVEIRPNFTG